MNPDPDSDSTLKRRSFLSSLPSIGAAIAAVTVPAQAEAARLSEKLDKRKGNRRPRRPRVPPPSAADLWRNAAYGKRNAAVAYQRSFPLLSHVANTDETLYPNFIGSFTKALPHNSAGEVDAAAYATYRQALNTRTLSAFNAIPMGGTAKLANPLAAFSSQLEGPESGHVGTPPAPALSSAWAAAEMVEVYWLAWTRDVPFIQFDSDPLIGAAAADISALPDYRGPRSGGIVTPGTIFRGSSAGALAGPFLSQFLWKDIPFGATTIPQHYRTTSQYDNHMTSFSDWLNIQNGGAPTTFSTPDSAYYIASGRDLAEYVHHDFSYQAYLSAALILLSFGREALDDSNPYKYNLKQGGFITFGEVHILDLVARVAMSALKAAWYQKWLVHRRLRPEAYGGLVHRVIANGATYPLHSSVLNSAVLPLIQSAYSTSLLPMAYPEGSPTHPAYPAGHATIAGACVTVLKAFFKETFSIPAPVQANAIGTSLLPYAGSLSVGGELDKLASNIAHGRDTAGVHWRSDGEEGLRLGEEVAIRLLRSNKTLSNDAFVGFSLTKFDGTMITV